MQTSDHAAGTDNFYPRPPRGGRLLVPNIFPTQFMISIHALREEGDLCKRTNVQIFVHFYPRPPRGGRLRAEYYQTKIRYISIHALREEGDSSSSTDKHPQHNFYPRPPRGGRQTQME